MDNNNYKKLLTALIAVTLLASPYIADARGGFSGDRGGDIRNNNFQDRNVQNRGNADNVRNRQNIGDDNHGYNPNTGQYTHNGNTYSYYNNGQYYNYYHNGSYFLYYANGAYYNNCTVVPAYTEYGHWYPETQVCN